MRGTYQDFFQAIRMRESSGNYKAENRANFLGAYQFGEAALIDLEYVARDARPLNNDYSGGWTGKGGINSRADFLNSPEAQDAAAAAWWPLLWSRIRAFDLEFYDQQTLNGYVLTKSGMIAASHLVGTGALKEFIESGGTTIRSDGNETPITEYLATFSNYDVPDTFLNNLDKSNNIVGGTGADKLNGFDGDDTLNGKAGADELNGGAGNDSLVGGAGNDLLRGGSGLDTATYATSASAIEVVIGTTGQALSIGVKDGLGGVDSLDSVEMIVGTPGRDILRVKNGIIGDDLTVDAQHGQRGSADIIDGSGLPLGGGFQLELNSQGAGSLLDKSTGGKINLLNFNTGIIGSRGNDTITDMAPGHKQIDSGDGNDVVTVGGDGAMIAGGAGDDTLTGGDGNDVLVGGEGVNILNGGAGHDHVLSSSRGNTLDGGDGHDYIEGRQGALATTISSGAGNDIIDFTQTIEADGFRKEADLIRFEFRTGDGRDSLVGRAITKYPDSSSDWDGLAFSDYGIDVIDFTGIESYDAKFVFELKESIFIESRFDGTNEYLIAADLAIVMNGTGDSLYLGRVAAYGAGKTPDTIGVFYDLSGPSIRFDNGLVQREHDLGIVIINEVFGSVAQYKPTDNFFSAVQQSSDASGGEGNDALSGGIGNDAVSGGGGDDSYQASGGQDTFDGGAGDDTLSLFQGTDAFNFDRHEDGSVLVTSRGGLEGSTLITGVEAVSSISDGASFAIAALAGDYGTSGDDALLAGTSRGDHLFGLAGDDTIRGGASNDVINGGVGTDVTLYKGNSTDFRLYRDVDGSVGIEDLRGAEGHDRAIGIETARFAGGVDVDLSSLPALGTAANDVLSGDDGANVLFGFAGDDVIDAGLGADLLIGGTGGDTYKVRQGDGGDAIKDDITNSDSGWDGKASLSQDHDVLDLTDFSPDAITVARSWDEHGSGDLLVTIGASGETTRVLDQFASHGDQGVERLTFAGGVSWDRATIAYQASATGTDGDDLMNGSSIGGKITGGLGSDTIISSGADTIIYAAGDGSDTIVDKGPNYAEDIYGDEDVLQLVGLNATDVTFTRHGHDLLMTNTANGQTVTLQDQLKVIPDDGGYYYGQGGMEYVQFGDGSFMDVWSLAEAASASRLLGTAGADVLVGTEFQDSIIGGAGDDRIFGIDGGDYLDGGDGSDDLRGTGDDDILLGGAGDDHIEGKWGADLIYGGDGVDTVVFSGDYTDYGFATQTDGSLLVTYNDYWGGSDDLGSIEEVEWLYFAEHDVTVSAIDFSFVGNPEPYLNRSLSNAIETSHAFRGSTVDIEIPTGVFVDPNDPVLTYSARLTDGSPLPTWLSLSGNHLIGTAPTTAYGNFAVEISASDGENSVADSFELYVGPETTRYIYRNDDTVGTDAAENITTGLRPGLSIDAGGGDDLIMFDGAYAKVNGQDGNDVILAWSSNAVISGGEGIDYFVFDHVSFHNSSDAEHWATITDFTPSTDVLAFANGTGDIKDFSQLISHATQVGNDVEISLMQYPSIVLQNTQLTSLAPTDFMFM